MSDIALTEANRHWWRSDHDKPHDDIAAIVKYIGANSGYRSIDNLRYLRLYGNQNILGVSAWQFSRTGPDFARTNRVTFNIVSSMCNTVCAKISKNRPRPFFLTEDGDWEIQRKAKKLNKFVQGQFYATEMYERGQESFLDSTVFDIGVAKFYEKEDKICVDRVFPDEILVDDVEGVYGTPPCLYQVKWAVRDALLDMFPDKIDIIKKAQAARVEYSQTTAADVDLVKIIEAWHLRSSKKAGDGRHALIISNGTLLDEDWDKDYFPFEFIRWQPRLRGFYGQGLAEQLIGIQLEINKLLRTIQTAMHLCSVPRFWLENGSKIVKAHLNNEIGNIVNYTGRRGELDASNAVPPELFSHLDYLVRKAYEIAGVSELSAQSKKPAGLNAAVALREYNDMETERFAIIGQNYERFYLGCAKQMINLAKDIYRRKKSFKVLVHDKRHVEEIDWGEIDLEESQYVMQIFPTSILPTTPEGKLQTVQELLQAGFISQEQGTKLLDFPDLESVTHELTANSENMDMIIDRMLDKGDYIQPESYQDLDAGIIKMQHEYLRAKLANCPEEKLELMRRWIDQAQAILDQVAAAQEPQAPPMALPAQAPTSDIMPIQPQAMGAM